MRKELVRWIDTKAFRVPMPYTTRHASCYQKDLTDTSAPWERFLAKIIWMGFDVALVRDRTSVAAILNDMTPADDAALLDAIFALDFVDDPNKRAFLHRSVGILFDSGHLAWPENPGQQRDIQSALKTYGDAKRGADWVASGGTAEQGRNRILTEGIRPKSKKLIGPPEPPPQKVVAPKPVRAATPPAIRQSDYDWGIEQLKELLNSNKDALGKRTQVVFPRHLTRAEGGNSIKIRAVSVERIITNKATDVALWTAYFSNAARVERRINRSKASFITMKHDAFDAAARLAAGSRPTQDWFEKMVALFAVGGRPLLENGWNNPMHILAGASQSDQEQRQRALSLMAQPGGWRAGVPMPSRSGAIARVVDVPWMLRNGEKNTPFMVAVRAGDPTMAAWIFTQYPQSAVGGLSGSVASSLAEFCDFEEARPLVDQLRQAPEKLKLPDQFHSTLLKDAWTQSFHNESSGARWRALFQEMGYTGPKSDRPPKARAAGDTILPGYGIPTSVLRTYRRISSPDPSQFGQAPESTPCGMDRVRRPKR